MNGFLVLFACLYAIEHLAALALTLLNLRHLAKHAGQVPLYFRDKISPEDYRRSIGYTRQKSTLGLVKSVVSAPVFWGMLLSGFFGRIDQWAQSVALSPVLAGLLFLAVMQSIFYCLSMPFSLYSTFVIEQRFGFNRTSLKTWVMDLLKGVVLAIVIGIPLLAGMLWFMDRHLSGLWWLYVWLSLAAVQLLLTSIFPVLLLPLFNKLIPLEEGSLREQIERIARQLKFRISGIYTMDGSKRSTHSNAFFAGLGRFRRIVLFDTLVASLNERELLAVLAHEMGHNLKHHVRTYFLLSAGSSLVGFFVLSLIINEPWFYDAFGFSQGSAHAALFIFLKAAGSFTFFFEPLFSALSRKHEYEADGFAASAIGSPRPMIEGLVKLTRDNLSNLIPHPLYSLVYYSHPTTLERIRALERRQTRAFVD